MLIDTLYVSLLPHRHMFQRLIIIIVASPWLKINHRISVKRDPDYSAPTCTSVWFPRMAVEKIQHKHVQACFP